MTFELAIIGAALSALVVILAGYCNSRRGLTGLSLVPWDYVLMLAALCLFVFLGQAASLWREF